MDFPLIAECALQFPDEVEVLWRTGNLDMVSGPEHICGSQDELHRTTRCQ